MAKSPQLPRLTSLLQRERQLDPLFNHLHHLKATAKLLQSLLPEPYKSHTRLANFQDNILTLHTSSAAWATKLRYQTPALITVLKQHPQLAQLAEIQIRTQHEHESAPARVTAAAQRRHGLDKNAAGLLIALAECVDDTNLANALQRLARHELEEQITTRVQENLQSDRRE
ncbi:MAG: hypothetical protein FD130_852 [Halothiobacillaceae bacterium]|nr:MAG: hypothetical protein FD130_852 [Halothiobacillaceae bacterium]